MVDYLELKLAKEEKLLNVPTDEGTLIKLERMHKVNGIDVLYQKWRWDAIIAESIIFLDEDVAGMTEKEIVKMVRRDVTCKKGTKVTFSQKGSGYTFVNYNFEEDEPNFAINREKIEEDNERVDKWEREIRERDEALKDKQKRQKPIG